ncbi:hypothetical protein P7C71_g4422, partial [Lecanoromycetidae sp. Uapishka_2]
MLLSGPKSWSIGESLQIWADIANKEVKIKQVEAEAYSNDPQTQEIMGLHGPEDPAKKWASTFDAVRRGETDVVTGDLERLLGRKPEGFEETIKRLANA